MITLRRGTARRAVAAAAVGCLVALAWAVAGLPVLIALGAFLLGTIVLARPALGIRTLVAYIIIVSDGLGIGGVPLIVPLFVLTMGAWLLRGTHADYRFALPVSVAAIGVPLLWTLLGLMGASDNATPVGDMLDQAEHFVFLLLYFPLRDMLHSLGDRRWDSVWLYPTYVLCGITFALWTGHEVIGFDYRRLDFPVFKPALAFEGTDYYRVFLKGHLLLIPAAAILWSRCFNKGRLSQRSGFGFIVVLAAAYLTETRGLWLGVGCALVIVSVLAIPSARSARTLAIGIAALALLGLTPVGGHVASRASTAVWGTDDTSIAIHFEQAPLLLAGFERSPIVGAGLGASLHTGYVRDPEKPYLYELSYHQLLFQLGAVGFAIVMLPFLVAVSVAIRSLPSRPAAVQSGLRGVVGGFVGVLVSSATNPYLISAFGLLALTVLLALADHLTPTGVRSTETRSGAARSPLVVGQND